MLIEQKTADSIIILGSGLHTCKTSPDGVKLSWDERMRICAGIELFQDLTNKNKSPKKIILCGGTVFQGFNPLSEISKRYLIRKTGLPEDRISLVNNSLDTIDDIKEAKKVMEEQHLTAGIVISNRYHLVARALAFKHGLAFRSAEDLLAIRDQRYSQIVQDIESSNAVRRLIKNQLLTLPLIATPILGKWIYQKMSRRTLATRAIIEEFDPNGLYKMVHGAPRPKKTASFPE